MASAYPFCQGGIATEPWARLRHRHVVKAVALTPPRQRPTLQLSDDLPPPPPPPEEREEDGEKEWEDEEERSAPSP
jgi:hypothetical protein